MGRVGVLTTVKTTWRGLKPTQQWTQCGNCHCGRFFYRGKFFFYSFYSLSFYKIISSLSKCFFSDSLFNQTRVFRIVQLYRLSLPDDIFEGILTCDQKDLGRVPKEVICIHEISVKSLVLSLLLNRW